MKKNNTNKTLKYLLAATAVLVLLSMLTGCMPGDGSSNPSDPAGLLTGIWHGWIAPISLVFSFFDSNINIYEVNNVGFWYDLGYYMAIVGGFFGLSLSRKNKNN